MKSIMFLIFFALAFVCADDLYVKSKYANLWENIGSKKAKKVYHGTRLLKIAKNQNWYKVKYQDKELWIYRGKVSRIIPRADSSLQINRYYDDEVATGNAMRDGGIGKATMRYAQLNGLPKKYVDYMDYHASFITTDKNIMEQEAQKNWIRITTSDLEKFLQEGKIGEYENIKDK